MTNKVQQLKKITSLLLIVSIMTLTIFFPSNDSYAKETTSSKSLLFSSAKEIEKFLSKPKRNIRFLKGDYCSLNNKYTCTCGQYSLKICEKAKNNSVYSKIYVRENKTYKFLAQLKTTIKGKTITYKFKTPYGKLVKKESFNLPSINNNGKKVSTGNMNIHTMASYDGMKVSGWKYYGTFK